MGEALWKDDRQREAAGPSVRRRGRESGNTIVTVAWGREGSLLRVGVETAWFEVEAS